MNATKRLAVIVGEPSGDRLAADLVDALRRRSGRDLSFFGVAGPEMQRQGVVSAFPVGELAVMGFLDVARALPRISSRLNRLARSLLDWRPDIVITVDSPDFCLRLQRRLATLGCPRLHYVAPKAWAWRPGRTKRLVRDIDHVLALFPFESGFFGKSGVNCSFVGHPALDRARQHHGERLDTGGQRAICLLPGSRRSEIPRHLPLMVEAAEALRPQIPGLRVLVPVVDDTRDEVARLLPGADPAYRLVSGACERWSAFAAADMAISKLGTACLELALADCPFVSIYRTDAVSAAIAGWLISSRQFALPNILLDRPLVPELIQNDLDGSSLARATFGLWFDDAERQRQREGFSDLRALMDPGDGLTAAERAADLVLSHL